MDYKLITFLQNEKLEEFFTNFQKHQLTYDMLPDLTDKMIDELITKFGPQIRFKRKLKQLNSSSYINSNVPTVDNSSTILFVKEELLDKCIDFDEETEETSEDPFGTSNLPRNENNSYDVNYPFLKIPNSNEISSINSASSSQLIKKRKITNDNCCDSNYKIFEDSFNLLQILKADCIGNALLIKYSNSNDEMDNRSQNMLVDIVITYFLNNDNFGRLVNNHFSILANEIVKIFPKESSTVFYAPPILKKDSRNGKTSSSSKGKLIDKYKDILKYLRSLLTNCTINTETNRNLQQNEINKDLHNIENVVVKSEEIERNDDWKTIKRRWTDTYSERKLYLDTVANIDEIYDTYPILTNNSAYTLIDEDFTKTYPKFINSFDDNFEDFFWKTLSLKKNNIKPNDKSLLDILENNSAFLRKDTKYYVMMSLLPSLIDCKFEYKANGNNWIPTTTEIRQGIINYIKTPKDIDQFMDNRIKKMELLEIPIHPYVIVQGTSIHNIQNSYVIINKTIQYCVPSVKDAIEVCFKLFHVFPLIGYPVEAQHIWLLIQLEVYKLWT